MDIPWRRKDLPEIVRALSQRPGHEGVRTLLAEILRHAFGAAYLDLDHEVRLPEVHGRVDTLFGATVFEFKRDLRRELPDVEARLPDYLRERERQSGRRSQTGFVLRLILGKAGGHFGNNSTICESCPHRYQLQRHALYTPRLAFCLLRLC